jgi:NAD(P)H-flavin reductase
LTTVHFQGRQFHCETGETLLDALQRQGVELSYSCKAGVCQTCLMRCIQGSVPLASQQELKANLRKQGYFLACQCVPEEDLHIDEPDNKELFVSAKLIDKKQLSPGVYRLRLQTAEPLNYHAGQFINVRRHDGVMRSYSLASLPVEDDWLELHVKRMNNGVMSNWLVDEFTVGDSIDIEGPVGSCFYSSEMTGQPLLLVGTGTGLAPLIGIVRDAIHNNHAGAIHLYHGAYSQEELYLDEALRELMTRMDNFFYRSCIARNMPADMLQTGRVCDIALEDNPQLSGWQVFLCGSPSMVSSMQKRVYLAGTSLQNIYTDPFETKELRKQTRGSQQASDGENVS